MITFAIKENGGALAIQGLQALESDAAGEVGNGFARDLTTMAAGRGHLRRIPQAVHLNKIKNFDRHGIESKAHEATARGIQFHGREQVHERSRFSAGHHVFAGREAIIKTERSSQKSDGGRLVSFHGIFSGRNRE